MLEVQDALWLLEVTSIMTTEEEEEEEEEEGGRRRRRRKNFASFYNCL